MKTIVTVSKFNQMVDSKSNPNFTNYIWKFNHKRGFVAFGTRSAGYYQRKKDAVLSCEDNYI